jgi:hypothetical protein
MISGKPVDTQGVLPYPKNIPCKDLMDYVSVFRDEYLTPEDLVDFANALNTFQELVGRDQCWCVKEANHPLLKSFTATHPYRPQFKGRDARVLSLALVDQFHSEEKPVIVRSHACKSFHCIHPGHMFYGTKADVQLEIQRRRGLKVSLKIINEIRLKRETDPESWTYSSLSAHYKLPLQTIGRICRREIYDF